MSEANEVLTVEQWRKRGGKARASRAKHTPGEMNKTERAYSELLDTRKLIDVAAWWFESWTFKLAHDCRYTPDFAVLLRDGSIELHECKGHMEDDALVKLKVAARMLPFVVRLARIAEQGRWKIEEVKP